ncbi:SDR family NAD(P)-dependent oxidoreductase [Nocardioides zhouii]|uniref:SDR family oxidoreductase n=1 Tax=Nocardioides zhouii TaxID=1168729 RepID=A0A4Q2SNY8_9ACTN|nr:SDR family NAD(P)-dependent oxidoreductase [Nocardioides zhouii]RYC05944.1 SDR family oxidoreductase [Nocardioides zhouii]
MERLTGRSILVTGATGGLGAASVRALAAEGAHVGVADLGEAAVRALADEVGGTPLVLDVTSPEDVTRVVDAFARERTSIDVLVNFAGIVDPRRMDEIEPEAWSRVFDVNVRGTWLMCNASIPHMPRGGSIVNIGSRAGLVGGTTSGASYAASKAAVICFTKSLAKFAAPQGIRANVINPGCIETAMLDHFAPEVRASMPGQAALGRLGSPAEIADSVIFLATSASSFMTGAQLNVNGGSHM